MPTWDFKCVKCKCLFTACMPERAPKDGFSCPDCGGSRLELIEFDELENASKGMIALRLNQLETEIEYLTKKVEAFENDEVFEVVNPQYRFYH